MKKYKQIKKLYQDHAFFAKKFGLRYDEDKNDRIQRKGKKENFSYMDGEKNTIKDKKIIKYIEGLVIPPMRKKTYICPDKDNYILVIGEDQAGRSQYLYHEKWSQARNLINSYKLILFGHSLGDIRKMAKKYLRDFQPGSYKYALGAFILVTDETVIRVGSEYYFNENDTVGLSVIKSKNIIQSDGRISFNFVGKSGKEQKINITDKKCKMAIKKLLQLNNEFLFSYTRNDGTYHIKATHANKFLSEYGNDILSIKDFRTRHASVVFFDEIVQNIEKNMDEKQRKKLIISGFDQAADKLGNTRAVVRSSYVHGDMVDTVKEEKFLEIYKKIKKTKKKRNLSRTESRFLEFLEFLYEHNFEI